MGCGGKAVVGIASPQCRAGKDDWDNGECVGRGHVVGRIADDPCSPDPSPDGVHPGHRAPAVVGGAEDEMDAVGAEADAPRGEACGAPRPDRLGSVERVNAYM